VLAGHGVDRDVLNMGEIAGAGATLPVGVLGRRRAGGATLMTLRNDGEPDGFSRLAAPLISLAMLSAMRKDLARLKALLERSGHTKA
jgi:hypothetical protein